MKPRLVNWAGTAVCLALATTVLLSAPLRDRQHDRVIEGSVGDAVSANQGRITVHDVSLAGTLTIGTEQITSPAVFVVLDVTAEALRRPHGIDDAKLVTADRERSYSQSVRATGNVKVGVATVGFPQQGSLVFELPRDAIAGATLRITDHQSFDISERIEVPLGLDDAAVTDQLRSTEPVHLPERVDPAAVKREYH